MQEKRMSCEIRTDQECEISGIPADIWAEAVFVTPEEEIAIEINTDQAPLISIALGPHVSWKGTVADLKLLLQGRAG